MKTSMVNVIDLKWYDILYEARYFHSPFGHFVPNYYIYGDIQMFLDAYGYISIIQQYRHACIIYSNVYIINYIKKIKC